MEQSAHPILGLDASKASYYSKQPFQGKGGSPPPRRLKSEARVLSVDAVVFHPTTTREGLAVTLVACRMTCQTLALHHLYILSQKSNFCLQQQQFHGAEQSVSRELQEKPILYAKYQGLINIAYCSWCG